ncbi:PREDICTED: sterile alpha motif domain-containing protein 3-like isoform X2 [Priapulus caudatus]|uniref:Sterile alpha motif domain-containing protein 3-like isoform X2 n=1 Tax=Priapulus caudatus TaxID=37621 RepID=A0ABM1DS05_PRICU|nr:PREDICTED: sterile alpha motif domain-containing protein 3-like isoform X2 [Priapulus caudatus]
MDNVTIPSKWSVEHVVEWLGKNKLDGAKDYFINHEIDGETLFGLTETMVGNIYPRLKEQVAFLKAVASLKEQELKTVATIDDELVPVYESDSTHVLEASPSPSRGSSPTLPRIPASLQKHLEAEDPDFMSNTKSAKRSRLVTILAEHLMDKYELFPKSSHYDGLLQALVKKYPFLNGKNGDNLKCLKECLRNKCKKERRPLTTVQEVVEMKRKFGSPGRGRPSKRTLSGDSAAPIEGKTRMCQTIETEAEDERSILLHLKALALETVKLRPNMDIVREKIRRTFTYRSNYYMDKSITTAMVIERFPWLRRPKFLLVDMDMQYRVNCERTIRSGLLPLCDNVTKRCPKPDSERLRQLLQEETETSDESTKKKSSLTAALLMLPNLLHESLANFIAIDQVVDTNNPIIQVHVREIH